MPDDPSQLIDMQSSEKTNMHMSQVHKSVSELVRFPRMRYQWLLALFKHVYRTAASLDR